MSGEGVPRLAVRVRAEDNLCECAACQLAAILHAAGHEIDGEAFADFHAVCTTPVYPPG